MQSSQTTPPNTRDTDSQPEPARVSPHSDGHNSTAPDNCTGELISSPKNYTIPPVPSEPPSHSERWQISCEIPQGNRAGSPIAGFRAQQSGNDWTARPRPPNASHAALQRTRASVPAGRVWQPY